MFTCLLLPNQAVTLERRERKEGEYGAVKRGRKGGGKETGRGRERERERKEGGREVGRRVRDRERKEGGREIERGTERGRKGERM